jgi:hypothetical protein
VQARALLAQDLQSHAFVADFNLSFGVIFVTIVPSSPH